MTECPADAVLIQLISDELSGSDLKAAELHLTTCASCQERLDELAGVTEMTSVLGPAAAQLPEQSPRLQRVMARLQSDSAFGNGTEAAAEFGRASRSTLLPELQPTRRGGYIGRLGDIDIRRVIGRGGMGVVFEGLDPILDRVVAVKVLSPHLVRDAESKSRFLREARAAAALAHENVVAIHAIDEADGMPFLVLQYVAGESLGERLVRQKKLPFQDVLRIGTQTAKGLAAAHERGLVHRDIKPGNILLEEGTGNVRIADFGLAKKVGLDSMTQVGIVAGTPAYMSPEQAADGPVDSRSDLFSLGIVLYQAASGRLPFTGESPYVILNKIRTAEPRPLNEVNPELPDWFCSIVHRLLEKEPEHRIGSARELAALLERKAAVAPVASRRSWLYAALGLLVLAGITYGIASRAGPNEPTPSVVPAITGFVVEGNDQPFPTLSEAITAAPDGGVITVHGNGPYPSPVIRIENKKLTVRAAAGSRPKFVPETIDNGPSQLFNTNADMHLEGLDIHWPISAFAGKPEELRFNSVISQSKGKLTLVSCRVNCGANAACVGSDGQKLTIDRCHLLASSVTGYCVLWKPSPAEVRIENTVMEGKVGILLSYTTTPVRLAGRMVLTRSTIATERAFQLFPDVNLLQPMPIAVHGNLFDNKIVVALAAFRHSRKNIDTHAAMTEVLQERISWTDEGNVYRKGTQFLTGSRPMQLFSIVPSDFKKLEQWLGFWKQSGSKSIEGIIAFQTRSEANEIAPLQLAKIDLPSGSIPVNVGADVASVGPR